jgi:hypothetical protein
LKGLLHSPPPLAYASLGSGTPTIMVTGALINERINEERKMKIKKLLILEELLLLYCEE